MKLKNTIKSIQGLAQFDENLDLVKGMAKAIVSKDENDPDQSIDGKLTHKFNKFLDAYDEYSEKKKPEQLMNHIDKSKNNLIVKVPTMSVISGLSAIDSDNSLGELVGFANIKKIYSFVKSKEQIEDAFFCNVYTITDTDDNILYFTSSSREILYDKNFKKLGKSVKHLDLIGIGLLEKDVKKSTVYIGRKKAFLVKGSKPVLEERTITITEYKNNRKIIHSCRIYNQQTISIKLEKRNTISIKKISMRASTTGYTNKYIITADKEDEVTAILLTMAIDEVF